MLTNAIKSIFRGLLRGKSIVLINVFGFALSLACCILVAVYVNNELSYDRQNKNFDRVYPEHHVQWAGIAPGTINGIIEFPEVEKAVRVQPGQVTVTAEGKKGFEEPVISVDSTFFDIFTVDVLAGSITHVLKDPSSMVITEKAAAKYFPNEDPIGKTLSLERMGDFKIAAIIKDPPTTAHFHYKFITSHAWNHREDLTVWGSDFGFYTYVLLSPQADVANLSAKFPAMSTKYLSRSEGDNYEKWRSDGNDYQYFLQPLKDIHLKSNLKWELEPNGNYKYLYVFAGSGLLILFIACINFMNLSTARYTTKAREVGIRKILGSMRMHLIGQFMLESILLSGGAIVLAVGIAKLVLPAFNELLNEQLVFNLSSPVVIGALIATMLFVGLISGSYPSFMLSSFRPIQVLGNNSLRAAKSGFRNKLVIIQFAISFFLIAGTLIVFSQISYMLSKDLGIAKEGVLVIDHANLIGNKAAFKNEIKKRSDILAASFMSDVPGKIIGASTFQPKGFKDQQELNLAIFGADDSFAEALGIKITRGRSFTESDYDDTSRYVILNEKAVEQFGWPDDPIGKELINDGSGKTHRVAGVVNDFHLESMHHEVRPLIIVPTQDWAGKLSLKVSTGDLPSTIAFLESKWIQTVPDRPFSYFFLDDFYDSLYIADKTLGQLFVILAGLAIVIASLGLLGLSVFMAEQRTKEIGVRKVVGASVSSIVLLLIRDLTKLIVIAMVIATPVSWYVLNYWLKGFAYRIDLGLVPFVVAGVVTLAIATVTIGFQAGKAALINPVNVLRNN